MTQDFVDSDSYIGSSVRSANYINMMFRSNYCAQVEANDAVTVAGMTRPKPLPNEVLSDLAVSAATKLQCYRVYILLSYSVSFYFYLIYVCNLKTEKVLPF